MSERVNRGAVAPNDWALFRGLVDELIRALEEKQGQMGSGAEGAESIEIDFGVQEKVSAGSSRSSGTENGT